jgi:hypothetical protein
MGLDNYSQIIRHDLDIRKEKGRGGENENVREQKRMIEREEGCKGRRRHEEKIG